MGKSKSSDWDDAFRTGNFNEDQMNFFDVYGVDKKRSFQKSNNMGQESPRARGERDLGYSHMGSAVVRRANEDYDTRRSIEAAALAGDEEAKKFANKSYKTVDDVYAAYQFLNKKGKELGIKQFDSSNDFAQITQAYARDAHGSQGNKSDDSDKLDYYNDQASAGQETEAESKPTEVEQAKTRSDAYERRMAPEYFGLDGRAGLRFSQSREEQNKARDFRDKFRDKLQMGINNFKD